MKKYLYFLFIAIIFFITGCSLLNQLLELKNPVVKFNNFQLTNISFKDISGIVNLKVYNPNMFSIPMSKIKTKVIMRDVLLLTLENDKNIIIAPNETKIVSFNVTLPFAKIPDVINVFRSDINNINLLLNSELYFDKPFNMVFPVNFNVNIPVPRFPSIKVSGVSLSKISFSNANILINLIVNNPNDFPIKNIKLKGSIYISNREIAQINEPIIIEANRQKTISINLKISTANLGFSLINKLKDGNIKPKVDGFIELPYGKINFKTD